jgi:ribosomal protein S18 acetylase RimI-like enzyme
MSDVRCREATIEDVEAIAFLHVNVRPEHQGKGVGSKLFNDLCLFLNAQGHHEIRLAVVAGNTSAISFYERLGGELVGTYTDGVLWRSENLVYRWQANSR